MGIGAYPPSATALGYGSRNKVRNGDFSTWQRGAGSFTSAAGGYGAVTADGWIFDYTGTTTNGVITRSQVTPGGEGRYVATVQGTGMSLTTDMCALTQLIEGVHTLQGRKVTLSFDAAVDAGTATISAEIRQNFGTGGTFSSEVGITAGNIAVDTTLRRKTVTFTMPSISGKSRGTNSNDYLEVRLWLSAGSVFNLNAGSIGIQNKTWTLGRVQLEDGGVATPFEDLPPSTQLSWCQRYFYRFTATVVRDVAAVGTTAATTVGFVYVQFLVQMRVAPTYSMQGSWMLSNRLAEWAVTTTTPGASSVRGIDINCGTAGGMTAGQATFLYSHNTAGVGAYIEFSAELAYL